jgi:hypothetical protein
MNPTFILLALLEIKERTTKARRHEEKPDHLNWGQTIDARSAKLALCPFVEITPD